MKPAFLLPIVAAMGAAGCATAPALRVPEITAIRAPAPGVLSAGRLAPGDVERLREAGVRQVIDLTADAETPDFDEAAAVREAGLAYANLPLRGGQDLTRDNVLAFDRMLRAAEGPVLVHCASGNRVGAMAALRAAWVQDKPIEDAIAVGKAWGLAGLEAEVRTRIQNTTGAASP